MPIEQLGVGPAAWLLNSLRVRASELRTMERRCAKAYTKGEMRVAAERLAATYAKAATAFEDAARMYCGKEQGEHG